MSCPHKVGALSCRSMTPVVRQGTSERGSGFRSGLTSAKEGASECGGGEMVNCKGVAAFRIPCEKDERRGFLCSCRDSISPSYSSLHSK